jgi:hypothetical protein
MMIRHLGVECWSEMEKEIQRVSHKRLYLEYDTADEGTVE